MYYPLSQITSNLYTNGNEYIIISTQENYIGYYWKDSKGKYFTGKTPQDSFVLELDILRENEVDIASNLNLVIIESDNLFLKNININFEDFNFIKTPDKISYNTRLDITEYLTLKNINKNFTRTSPSSSPNFPSSLDYTNGVIIRYFCKKTNQTIYLEINKDTYDKLVKQDPSILWELYQPFTLIWTLKGNREQVAKNNQNTIERISNQLNISMLAEFLKKDYTKYYKYPDASNLYTKGNELKTVQDNKIYIGFYHIHPDKGYMVGATHVLEPHAYLSPINGFSYSGLPFKDTSKPSPTSNTPSTGGGMSSGGGY